VSITNDTVSLLLDSTTALKLPQVTAELQGSEAVRFVMLHAAGGPSRVSVASGVTEDGAYRRLDRRTQLGGFSGRGSR
jgi:hypothetical protein